MSSSEPPRSSLPPSMGPGARAIQPGENPNGGLKEIAEIRSHYNVHLASDAVEVDYNLNGQQRHYRLSFDNMPVGGLTQSLCWGGPRTALISGTMLIDLIRASENMTGRRITQEEAEGIAFYSTRRIMTMYVGQLAGIGVGGLAAWYGRKEMKFPFMSPKDPARYESFPMRTMPILRGWHARVMWQITRTNVYIFMWLFLSNPLFRSVADTRMTVGLYADRRTHSLTEAIKGRFDRLRSNRASEAAQRIQSGAPSPRPTEPQDEASSQSFDDRQSYSGRSDLAGDSTFTDGNTDTGLISDDVVQQRRPQQTSPNSWSRAQSRGSRESLQKSPDQQPTSSSEFFFDDASPTAGNDPDMNTSQPYSKQRQGSAWARLRRGESIGHSNSPQKQSDDPSSYGSQSPDFETKSDDFTFSRREGDRRLAKEQAQKDFDAMLDRERREGGADSYARDMQATQSGEESNSSAENAWSRRRRG